MTTFEAGHPSPESAEQMTQPDFENYIASVGNHENKLLMTAIILARPDHLFSDLEIYDEFTKRQGAAPAWIMAPSAASDYCKHSLEPAGVVVADKIEAGADTRPTYKAQPVTRAASLALTGLLLEWSLKNPELSVQEVFGNSHSVSKVRSPVARYNILSTLVAANEPLTTTQMTEQQTSLGYSRPDYSIARHLRTLETKGLISLDSDSLNGRNPLLYVTDPLPNTQHRSFDKLTPVAQAVYLAMRDIYDEDAAIDLDTFIEVVSTFDDSLSPHAIRRSLRISAQPGKVTYKGIQVVSEPARQSKQSRTLAQLKPHRRAAISELIMGLDAIRHGSKRDYFSQKALAIIADPISFNVLVGKARDCSPQGKRADGGALELRSYIQQQIMKKTVTAAELQSLIKQDLERKLDINTVRTIATELGEEGLVEITEVHHFAERGLRRTLKAYRAPSSDSCPPK